MVYDWYNQHRRLVNAGLAALLVVTISWMAWTYTTRIGKVGLTINAVPADAAITINGQPFSTGTAWLTPGTYTVKAQKDGFSQREKRVIVDTKKKQNVTSLGLTPLSDTAKKWADSHQQDYKNNEVFGSLEAQSDGEYFATLHPIIKQLPFQDPYFNISYLRDQTNPDNIVLTIKTPSPRYRYFAIQKLRQMGHDPSDYRIQFNDFTNPLGGNNE